MSHTKKQGALFDLSYFPLVTITCVCVLCTTTIELIVQIEHVGIFYKSDGPLDTWKIAVMTFLKNE